MATNLLKLRNIVKGFSLPELTTVLLIGSIFVLISVPSIINTTEHINIKKEHKRLEKFIQNLVLESKKRGVAVKFTAKNTQYEAETLENSRSFLGYRKLPSSISVALSSNNNSIIFYGNGVNAPSTIILQSSQKICSLSISLRGRTNSKCR